MKHAWMNAVAVAALTAGLAAANAQSPGEQKRPEPQAQGQGQSQTPDRSSDQPSAKQERGGQGQSVQGSGSEAKSGAADGQKSGTAQKEDGQKAGTAQKDDASRSTQSEQKGSQQDRKTTQTPDRDSDKRGERAGSGERKDSGTAQSRDRDNQRAGQRDRDDDRADRRDRDERGAGDRDRSAGDRDRDRDRTADDRRDRQGDDRVQFSERERTTIQESIRREKVERTNINVNISIGATIPRSVRLHALPAAIVGINPAYRSYRYVVVHDEIVIINPQTYRVVEVLPYSGSSSVRASRSGGGSRSVQLSTDQRRRILSYARAECDTVLAQPDFQIDIGTRIPERIELCPFEEVLIQEVDVVRPYRYFVVRDEVVLVDPSDHTIVEVIR
jgi:hypothetical protein